MKTTKENRETFEEIVFSERNKTYGAYLIRKEYPKSLSRGLMISVTALLVGIGIPLIASLYNQANVKPPDTIVSTVYDNLDNKPDDEIDPPPPPEDTKAVEEETRFQAPVPTEDTANLNPNIFSMDDLNSRHNSSLAITDTFSAERHDPPPVIETPEPDKVYIDVKEMPEFPGGEDARLKFIHDNVVYPKEARENGITGTVYLSFVIDEKGHVINVTILRGIGGGCENEAARVLAMMPDWKPGKQSGMPVKVRFNVPVKFEFNQQ